ncbi:hypothetical protein DWY25_09625 [Holdemania filiformis]|uniref:Uncharacterized protein n=1 Tax=Holdemania filiformis TaxID=61171 RepID=A0A412G0X3_9FIRM|nr:hypothetical protein DWY25_09625 [Holdemania filiformis]
MKLNIKVGGKRGQSGWNECSFIKKKNNQKRAAAITPQTQGRLETASVKERTSEMIVNSG